MSDRRTQMVGEGYDAMAGRWESWSAQVTGDPRHAWVEGLLAVLPQNATVVELGCGNGTRDTQRLAERIQLTAVDRWKEQLRRARERIPGATSVQVTIREPEGAVTFHWVLARR